MEVLEICKSQFNLRVYDEGIERIKKVLTLLSEDEVWYRPNDESNSVGNLVLHLCGNVTQWVGSGIGLGKVKAVPMFWIELNHGGMNQY